MLGDVWKLDLTRVLFVGNERQTLNFRMAKLQACVACGTSVATNLGKRIPSTSRTKIITSALQIFDGRYNQNDNEKLKSSPDPRLEWLVSSRFHADPNSTTTVRGGGVMC